VAVVVLVITLLVAAASTLGMTRPAHAADASPGTSPGASASPAPGAGLDDRIRLSVEPLLGGLARPGHWATIRVRAENDGPVIDGELRLSTLEKRSVRYAAPVQLPTGARQEHPLQVRMPVFGRFRVELITEGSVRARVDSQVLPVDEGDLAVGIVAEQPGSLIQAIDETVLARPGQLAEIRPMALADLPALPQAWQAMDLLVWQDAPAVGLTEEQRAALVAWVAGGGRLVLLGGSMGPAAFEGLPGDVLPYQPSTVVDIPPARFAELLGVAPDGPPGITAVAGPDGPGTVLARVDGLAVAATRTVGRGSVTLLGIDPAARSIVLTPIARALWLTILPAVLQPDVRADSDGRRSLASALASLPAVSVPRQDHLLALLVLYLLLIGPISYLVLKRMDRLSWAWVTTPILIGVFAVAAFVLGVILKGTTVVVRELAIVPGGVGTGHGAAEVQLSVFTPNRTTFDVRVPDGALLSDPLANRRDRRADPIDILVAPSMVRSMRVDSGAVGILRLEAGLPIPEVRADLALVEGVVEGTIENRSDVLLEDLLVLHGGGMARLGDLAPGARLQVHLPIEGKPLGARALRRRLFPEVAVADAETEVARAGRIALLDRAAALPGWPTGGPGAGAGAGDPALILAWRPEPPVAVDVGTPARTVGDTLYVLTAPVAPKGIVALDGTALLPRQVDATASTAAVLETGFSMDRGTMTVLLRPTGLGGVLAPTGLLLRLDARRASIGEDAEAVELAPLPDALQPDQADPLGPPPSPTAEEAPDPLPSVQLFDRTAGRWVELPAMERGTVHRIPDPDHYVDGSGAFLVRFVHRTAEMPVRFALEPRLEGTVS
jgi:hypothetical protein